MIFYSQRYFKYIRYELYASWSKYSPMLSYLKHQQSMDSLSVAITKPLKNHRGETFWEGLEWRCKPFETDG